MKIFLTVGNDYHSFHRLINKIDEIALTSKDDITIQYGHSTYVPINVKSYQFVDREKFYDLFKAADLIISHAGIGTVIDAIQNKKKMILVPKQFKLGEHFNNHQMEIADQIRGKYENIVVIEDVEKLQRVIEELGNKKLIFPDPPDIKKIKMVAEIKELLDEEKV